MFPGVCQSIPRRLTPHLRAKSANQSAHQPRLVGFNEASELLLNIRRRQNQSILTPIETIGTPGLGDTHFDDFQSERVAGGSRPRRDWRTERATNAKNSQRSPGLDRQVCAEGDVSFCSVFGRVRYYPGIKMIYAGGGLPLAASLARGEA